jgi:hypothetical protein
LANIAGHYGQLCRKLAGSLTVGLNSGGVTDRRQTE